MKANQPIQIQLKSPKFLSKEITKLANAQSLIKIRQFYDAYKSWNKRLYAEVTHVYILKEYKYSFNEYRICTKFVLKQPSDPNWK